MSSHDIHSHLFADWLISHSFSPSQGSDRSGLLLDFRGQATQAKPNSDQALRLSSTGRPTQVDFNAPSVSGLSEICC